MNLPSQFTSRMKDLLKEEYNPFLQSYHLPRQYGLRVNTLKTSVSDFLNISPFALESIPWTPDGFYYDEEERPGKHPYYHAGLYYIQEPSAMFPAVILDARPGERVLDLCAAPGGKTIQLAAGMKGEGVLVANDNNPQRIKALVKNIELYGVKNAIVTNETPDKLARIFPAFFDRILVDAPCSGEGMFRKDPSMVKSWNIHSVEACTVKQQDILKHISPMLKPGGVVVYSTCTFAPEENEQVIDRFLHENSEFELLEIPKVKGMVSGREDWLNRFEHPSEPESNTSRKEMTKTARLWPHLLKGEGHFVALLRKKNGVEEKLDSYQPPSFSQKDIVDYRQFVKSDLHIIPEDMLSNQNLYLSKDRLYLTPGEIPYLQGLKVARKGWFLGTLKKNRFEPSHSLIMGLSDVRLVKKIVSLSADDEMVTRYLRGETLPVKTEGKGWYGVSVDGFLLGWAKAAGGILKNQYPPGWRAMM